MNPELETSPWTVQLRTLPNGQIGLSASLARKVTALEVTVTPPSGSPRTVTVPKDSDLEAKLSLGHLLDGAWITVTAIAGEDRGPPLALMWCETLPPSRVLREHVRALESLAERAELIPPAELVEAFHRLSENALSWPDSESLYLWSDAGSATRAKISAAIEAIAEVHPDLANPGASRLRTRTFSRMVEEGRAVEQVWRKQAERLAEALDRRAE